MEDIKAIPNNNYEILFIHEHITKLASISKAKHDSAQVDKATLDSKNIQAIQAIQTICNVLVVLFYGDDLYSIGEVKVVNENEAKLINGVTFKFPLKKLLKECTNEKLSTYLGRLLENKF